MSERIINIVDSDQTPNFAASDPGLHCLPMSPLWDARLKWVKVFEGRFADTNGLRYT